MKFSLYALAAALSITSTDAFVVSPFSRAITSFRAETTSNYSNKHFSVVNGDISESIEEADATLTEAIESALGTESPKEEAATIEEKPFQLILDPVPPPSYTVETTPTAPGSGSVHTLTIHLGSPGHPEPIVIQTGKIGRQAGGAVTLTRGESVLYATASRDKQPREHLDFVPLSVEHQERFSSAGLTSGAFNKRDGRPAEHEILVCRLIDRPLRPLISEGWRHETQLLSWILSYDGVRTCDPLAITASATALWLSDVPLLKPVAAAMVGFIEGTLVLNPTVEQMKYSRLNLMIAGTKDAVMMIEGAADFLSEEEMMEAVSFGHEAIKIQCEAIEELGRVAGKEKKYDTIKPPVEGLKEEMDDKFASRVDEIFNSDISKEELSAAMSELSQAVKDEFTEKYPESESEIMGALKDLECSRMFAKAKARGIRIDGRKLNEVRQIDSEAGLFPRVHGSALFTRGQTQVVATATLGDSGMRQKIDKISGMEEKRFYLQYSFPPSCVGETGRVGAPGRREVGHGNLAERALIPTLPSEEDFPYTIRVESLVTESNGSSSMASVCGGCLALMDAGVPIKSPVAGIAMGE
jgi:polyribonucleotide nucleotidyltransferase